MCLRKVWKKGREWAVLPATKEEIATILRMSCYFLQIVFVDFKIEEISKKC